MPRGQSIGAFVEEVDSGIYPGVPQTKVPLWIDGSNVVFREGGIKPWPPARLLAQKISAEEVRGMISQSIDGEPTAFWGTASALFMYDAPGAVVDVTGTTTPTGTDGSDTIPATLWSFAPWGRFTLATNGREILQIKLPLADFVNVTGMGWDTAEIVKVISNHIMVLNTGNSPTPTDNHIPSMYEWADADSYTTWTPAADNSAGANQIRELQGGIIAAEALGEGIGVYGKDQLFLISFIGAPFYFGHQHLIDGVGAHSKHAVAPIARVHYGWGPRGIWRTDGVNFEYIDAPVRDYILADINPNYLSKIFAWHNETLQVVVFFYPSGGSIVCDKGVAFNYAAQHWTIPGFARTAATGGSVFPYPLSADEQGNIWNENVETEAGGAVVNLPLLLTATAQSTLGYNYGGYNQAGYGGESYYDG